MERVVVYAASVWVKYGISPDVIDVDNYPA